MAYHNQDLDDLGRSIQNTIDRAVNSRDFQQLDQTIRQIVDRAAGVGSEAVRKAMDSASRSASGTTVESRRKAGSTPVVQKKNLPALYGSTGSKTVEGVLKTVGGGLVSLTSFLAFFSTAIVRLVFTGGDILSFSTVFELLCLGAGIGLLCGGIRTLGWVGRFKTYQKTLGEKTHCTLERLARGVGKSVQFVRKELRQMIDAGLFLEGHMDKEETCLITSNETYQLFERSRLQLEARQQQEARQKAEEEAKAREAAASRDPRVQEVLDRGNAFLAQIRTCNDAIPGEEISRKISRMEMIVQKIFQRAEAHPEIVPDLKKLMDYYLPMTVKLLNAYADMDGQPVQGENIANSKREIEDTLDTLNLAFEKLLDSVFADTAMDVSSDISVLNTLLAQEGLTEDELSKMKRNQSML